MEILFLKSSKLQFCGILVYWGSVAIYSLIKTSASQIKSHLKTSIGLICVSIASNEVTENWLRTLCKSAWALKYKSDRYFQFHCLRVRMFHSKTGKIGNSVFINARCITSPSWFFLNRQSWSNMLQVWKKFRALNICRVFRVCRGAGKKSRGVDRSAGNADSFQINLNWRWEEVE